MAARRPIVRTGGRNKQLAVGDTLEGVEPTIAAGTAAQFWRGDKTWQSLLSAVQGTLLTGYAVGANAALVATDSVLGALQKLQAQLNSKLSSSGGTLTGDVTTTGQVAWVTNSLGSSWARGMRYTDSAGTWQASIGALGSTNTITNVYMGLGESAWSTGNGVRVTSAGVAVTGTLTAERAAMTGVGNDYASGGAELRGNGEANTVFPTLGFHQPALYASSLQLRAGGDFRFYAQGAGSYANVTANNYTGAALSLTGRATVGDVYSSGWLRTAGAAGWYNETYAGGMYMTDTTYVRTYNGKSFLCNDAIQIEGSSPQIRFVDIQWGTRYLYADGGSIGFLNSAGSWSLQHDNAGNTTNVGNISINGTFYGNGAGITNVALNDSGWITPTLIGGWYHHTETLQYRKIGKHVFFRGRIACAFASNNTPAFYMPAGYLPYGEPRLACLGNVYFASPSMIYWVPANSAFTAFDGTATSGTAYVCVDSCSYYTA